MIFKKFIDFILEGKKVDPKKKDIEDVQPQMKDSDPSVPLVCPKCGEKENLHFNYDYSKPNLPIEEVLCNECGTFFELKN